MTEQPAATRRPPPAPGDFPAHVTHSIRFGDLDAQGHVNNAVFATLFETGRVALFRGRDLGVGVEGVTIVLVRSEIDFLRELHWPGTVEIATGVERFGRTSFTMRQAIFDTGRCAATGRATLVVIDSKTRRARPLPDALVEKLRLYALTG